MSPAEWERWRALVVQADRAKRVGGLVLLFVVYMAAMWLLWR